LVKYENRKNKMPLLVSEYENNLVYIEN
jgi:hypothetical protein